MNPPDNLNQDVRARWDTNAAFWDERMGEGNQFHRWLVEPPMLELLQLQPGERVLDIGTGTGHFARKLASLGGRVTATDFSAGMLNQARAHAEPYNDTITYQFVDATDELALLSLGDHNFDAITSTMALMDMADIGPLFRAIPALLAPNGRFVVATMHPAFNSNNPVFMAESADIEGQIVESFVLKQSYYLTPRAMQGIGILGQPVAQYYFHRPLHEILAPAFQSGLVLDGLLEPRIPEHEPSGRWSSWFNYLEFPPVLALRFRPTHTSRQD